MGWRVIERKRENGMRDDFHVFSPDNKLRFKIYEPYYPPSGYATAYVIDHDSEQGFYLDDAGSRWRSTEAHGSPGEWGWLLDLLREQTGLPWVAGEETDQSSET